MGDAQLLAKFAVVDVIKVTTPVAYGRKLLGQCYKTFIRS